MDCGVFQIYPQIHAPVLVELDLADLAVLESKAKEILDAFGHVDVLLHNAGLSSRGSVMDNSFSVDFEVMKINYLAPVALTKGRWAVFAVGGAVCELMGSSLFLLCCENLDVSAMTFILH